jgi:hypothetical protein
MRSKLFVLAVAILIAVPVFGVAAQRGARRGMARMNQFAGVQPAQVWRLTTLTLDQRRRLQALQAGALRELGGGDRRAAVAKLRDLQSEIAPIVPPAQLAAARSMPRGPLAPEEIVYFPITSLPTLDAARRAKIDAVLLPEIAEARDDAAQNGRRRGRRAGTVEAEKARGEARQERLAYYELLDALLSTEEMAIVNGFLPNQLRKIGLKERVVYRLPSLTLEQEAQARAIFAALEDETAADRARLKAIATEIRGDDVAPARRGELARERREVQMRVETREKSAYADLGKALGAEQMRELEAQRPGPPRPTVFTPEAIAKLDLTPDQRRRIERAFVEFRRGTRDERTELRELRQEAKGADMQSIEMAATRDKIRRAAEVVDDERDAIVHTIAETLTTEQLRQLFEIAKSAERQKGKKLEPAAP